MSRAARVIPFERLRMTDVDAVGGKNASLGRDDQPARRRGHPRSRRLRDHGRGVPRVPRRRTSSPERIAQAPRDARRRRRHGARRAPAPRSGGWIVEAPLPPALDADDRRAPMRRLTRPSPGRVASRCARRRRPRTCPTPRSPGSRKHFSISMAWTIFFTRYERYLRRSTTIARSPTACTRASRTPTSRSRPACSGWCAATSGAAGVMFTLDTESGFDQVVFITVVVRPGRDRRAGRGEPGRVLRLQAATSRPAGRRSCARRVGAKAHEDGVRRRRARPGTSTATVDGAGRRAHALLDHRRRGRGARALRASPSRSTTAARWTSSGAATASTASSTSCRRGPRR